jgi:hypothetical protein
MAAVCSDDVLGRVCRRGCGVCVPWRACVGWCCCRCQSERPLKQNFPVKTLQNASFLPVDASIGAAFARLIGLSVGLAGLQRRAAGRRRGLASCPSWVDRCRAHRGPRSRAAFLSVPPLRPRSRCPPDRNRLKSVWRGAQRSPGVQPRHLGVSDDVRASFHRVRDAQRPRCPFQAPSRGPFVPQTHYAWDNVFPRVYRGSETGASI